MPFKVCFLLCSEQCSVNSRVRCTEWYILFLYSAPHNILRSKIWASLFSRLSVSVSPLSDSPEQWSGLFTKRLDTNLGSEGYLYHWTLATTTQYIFNFHLSWPLLSFVTHPFSKPGLDYYNVNVKYKSSDEWCVFNLYFQIKAINNEIKKYFVISFRLRWWNQCSIEVG